MNDAFAKEVVQGLQATPKRISSQYFYDEKGSKLFQKIMSLPTYYLTQAEKEIFEYQSTHIAQKIYSQFKKPFELFELGAGDATKTEILLKKLIELGAKFSYVPSDIDANILSKVTNRLTTSIPTLPIKPMQLTHDELILNWPSSSPKCILFLGSNIGNYRKQDSLDFLKRLSRNMHTKDLLMLGLDRKKNPELIRKAYTDPDGITASFNMNLLHRINATFDGNIPTEKFSFYAQYNIEDGEVRSYLVAKEKLDFELKRLNLHVTFDKWEYLHTEISRKHSLADLKAFEKVAKLEKKFVFTDAHEYFWEVLFEKI